MYLTSKTTSGADVFTFDSASQLSVATNGSSYAGNIAIGREAVGDYSNEWFHLSTRKTGVNELCCGVSNAGLLSCDYGALFGYCYEGQLWEGSAEANQTDYYYSAMSCLAVSLKVVSA